MLEQIQNMFLQVSFYDYRYIFCMILGFLFILLICVKIIGYHMKGVLIVTIIGNSLAYVYTYLINKYFGTHLLKEEIAKLTFSYTIIFSIVLMIILIIIINMNDEGGNE